MLQPCLLRLIPGMDFGGLGVGNGQVSLPRGPQLAGRRSLRLRLHQPLAHPLDLIQQRLRHAVSARSPAGRKQNRAGVVGGAVTGSAGGRIGSLGLAAQADVLALVEL
eukprot:scaffold15580_cov62-Isochrysis_galbana.AAC.1